MIHYIKKNNKDNEKLQGIDIKWIKWCSVPKAGQELTS